LVEQSSQGNFVPQGHQDILIEAIGRPEHHGHVRPTERKIGIKHYFEAAPRHSSSFPTIKTKAKITSKIHQ